MVARFRVVTKSLRRRLRREIFGHHRGERLRAEPYGGFLVNFLCKENWNVGTSGTWSKEVTVTLPALRGFGLSLTQRRNHLKRRSFLVANAPHILGLYLGDNACFLAQILARGGIIIL